METLLQPVFKFIRDPDPSEIGETIDQFIHYLGGPAHILIPGRQSGPARVVVTLLHGNEPSGMIAIYHLIRAQIKPVVDIHCFIVNVPAAVEGAGFFYRMRPGMRDLNRCFGEVFLQKEGIDDEPGRLAKALIDELLKLQPQAVLDIHNTSGSGPSFSVITFLDQRHDALASLFTHRLIVTRLKLGALMELSEHYFPTVTIECGGAQDEASHQLARDGLEKYFCNQDIFSVTADVPLQYFHDPIRLELTSDLPVYYGTYILDAEGLTLKTDIEHYNFGIARPGSELAYVEPWIMEFLTAKDIEGRERVAEFFHVENKVLSPKVPLHMFMVTGNPSIAKSDCLFYFIPA